MKQQVKIDVRNISNMHYFLITGRFKEMMQNKRLLISLKRLRFNFDNEIIFIPFREESKIKTLQEIQKLLHKFDYIEDLAEKVKQDLKNFDREESLFGEFTEKAKSIRDNKFEENPKLIEDFNEFQKSIKKHLKRELYPLQLLSAFHMAFSQNSCNFAVPGAGKTSIVYAAYSYLKNLPEDNPKYVDRLIVIGPISSFAPWENEFEDCFGYSTTFQRLSGDNDISKGEKLQHLYSGKPSEVTLIYHGGVDSFLGDISDFLIRNKTMVVIDEAHRIKNPDGVWGRSVTEISKEARARVILTGTPVPNGYQDIFNLYKFIYPFKYKDILNFHYQNLVDMTYNDDFDSPRVLSLKENLAPFFIRIRKKDLELPPVEEKVVRVNMSSHQREIYDFIESDYIEMFQKNGSATVKDILNRARLIRLRQASTNPGLLSKTIADSFDNEYSMGEINPKTSFTSYSDEFIDDSEILNKIINYSNKETPVKYIAVANILNNDVFLRNDKAIIWTIFIQNAKGLQEYLSQQGISSKLLIGEIEQQEREERIRKFNNPSNTDFQVIIANPFSVAESISLHKGCHTAIYLERDYNCSNFIQSKDRIHRVGLPQGQLTYYYYIVSNDSIDEVVNNRLRTKIIMMEKIINDEIPLFNRIDNNDETDIIQDLLKNYAERT